MSRRAFQKWIWRGVSARARVSTKKARTPSSPSRSRTQRHVAQVPRLSRRSTMRVRCRSHEREPPSYSQKNERSSAGSRSLPETAFAVRLRFVDWSVQLTCPGRTEGSVNGARDHPGIAPERPACSCAAALASAAGARGRRCEERDSVGGSGCGLGHEEWVRPGMTPADGRQASRPCQQPLCSTPRGA